jgi:prepilin-type N-terminal cleavage/methylation domain-containing protein
MKLFDANPAAFCRQGVPRPRGGFTLLELMVVVGVMAIVLSMGVPTIYRMWHRESLRRVTNEIQDIFIMARARAILQGVPTEVVIHPAERRLEIVSGSWAGAGGGEPALDAAPVAAMEQRPTLYGTGSSFTFSDRIAIVMLDVNLLEYSDAEVARVRFFPNGTCDEMVLVLESDERAQSGIMLEITTGIASILHEADLQRMAYGRR